MRRWIVGLSLLCLCGQASAINGGQLKRDCEGSEGTFGSGFCTGYIIGSVEGRVSGYVAHESGRGGKNLGSGHAVGACLPAVSEGQIVDVVKKWLREHPESHHKRASLLITRALREGFGAPPCN